MELMLVGLKLRQGNKWVEDILQGNLLFKPLWIHLNYKAILNPFFPQLFVIVQNGSTVWVKKNDREKIEYFMTNMVQKGKLSSEGPLKPL